MNLEPLDLVVRFDSSSNTVLLLVPKSPQDTGTLKKFFAVSMPEKIVVSQISEELGIAVASFFYARYSDKFHAEEVQHNSLEETQGSQSTFDDARLLIARLNDKSSHSDVDAVEALLMHAKGQGNLEAKKYLEDVWPKLRSIYAKRIGREG